MSSSELNQLTGKLLRSGRIGEYQFLGSGGRQVFKTASQLRDIVRRKLKTIDGLPGVSYAEHFAVPVIDRAGDVINWYSSYPGDVIPWSSATEQERDSARQQLRTLESKILEHCRGEQGPGSDTQAADFVPETLINKLLLQMLYTPDSEHIYLVNGLAVLTFWGFIYPKAQVPTDPLRHLFEHAKVTPAVAPVLATAAPLAQAAAVTPEPVIAAQPAAVAVVKKPWWRRWLWWLLLLLLLLLLLFGLRQCRPDMANKLGVPDFSFNKPELSLPGRPNLPNLPDLGLSKAKIPAFNGAAGRADVAGANLGQPDLPGLPNGVDTANMADSADPAQAPEMPAQGIEPPAVDPESPADFTPPDISEPDNPAFTPPQIPDEQAEAEANAAPEVPGENLQIPPDAPNGQAHFLNGKWKAGAGIQDKNTGKPLRLEYEFNEGKGQVTVKAADGMRCTGDVDAQVQGGQMRIESLGPALCADGSSFDMPEITCKPGAASAADCIGNYADTRFPISMRNAQ